MNGDDFLILSDTDEVQGRHITAQPSSMVCSMLIDFDIVDGKIRNLHYQRGCNGNLQAIGKLLEGMPVEQAAKTLRGIDCNGRGTSCTDQLARILNSLEEQK